MEQLIQKPVGVYLAVQTPQFNAGDATERLWVVVNFSKKDNEPAGHVLFVIDFVANVHCDEDKVMRLKNKFRLSNLSYCSQLAALESHVDDTIRISDKFKFDRFQFVTFDDFEIKIWRFDFQKGLLELLKRVPVECRDLSQIAVLKGLQMFAFVEKGFSEVENRIRFVTNEGKTMKSFKSNRYTAVQSLNNHHMQILNQL